MAEYTNQPNNNDASSPQPDLRRDNSTTDGQETLINPGNYHHVLGSENVVLPPDQQLTPEELAMQKKYIGQQIKESVPPADIAQDFHSSRAQQANTHQTPKGENETLKLVIYIVPVLAIVFLLTKAVNDKDFMWHVRQSLVAQAVWYGIMIVISLLNLPIISTLGLTLIKVGGYGLLIYAGAMAYSHIRFKIPVVYDLGKNFIEEDRGI